MSYDLVLDVFEWNLKRGLLSDNIDVDLEYTMLLEELEELKVADNKVDVADALADIIWVAVGSLSKLTKSYNKVESIMQAVAAANWTKGTDTDNGKITKPVNFVGPEEMIEKILEEPKGLFDE